MTMDELNQALSGLQTSPMFQYGVGILANRGNVGAGLQQGMGNIQNAQRMALYQQMLQNKLKAEEEEKARRARLQSVLGSPGMVDNPVQYGQEGPPMVRQGTGIYSTDPAARKQALLAAAQYMPAEQALPMVQGLMTPPAPSYMNVSPGATVFDKTTGEAVYSAPQSAPDWMAKYQWALQNPSQAAKLRELGIIGTPLVDMRKQQIPTDQEIMRGDILSRAEDARSFNAGVLKSGYESQKNIANYVRAINLLNNVETGPFQESLFEAKRLAGQLGMKVDWSKITDAEELLVLFGNEVMSRVTETKGAVSEKEMELFTQYSANFGKTPEGNKRILAFKRAKAKRDAELANIVRSMRKQGKSSLDIQEDVWEHVYSNDLTKYLQEEQADLQDKQAGYSSEDIEYTAKKHNISVEEVKKRLGIR